jgi:hypothetical protein
MIECVVLSFPPVPANNFSWLLPDTDKLMSGKKQTQTQTTWFCRNVSAKLERNKIKSNQARALLGRSNMGTNGSTDQPTNGPTNRRMKSLIEALARA